MSKVEMVIDSIRGDYPLQWFTGRKGNLPELWELPSMISFMVGIEII